MVALSFPVNPVASLFPYPVGLRDSLTTRSVGVGGDRLHGATGVRLFLAQRLGPTDPDTRMSWSSRRRCRPRSTPTRSGPADRPYSSGSISQRPWPGRTCGATRSGRTSPHSYPGWGPSRRRRCVRRARVVTRGWVCLLPTSPAADVRRHGASQAVPSMGRSGSILMAMILLVGVPGFRTPRRRVRRVELRGPHHCTAALIGGQTGLVADADPRT
ncbi:MAG: hypothetical protein QOH50_1391 [Kribbellaceae bacterium]|nr:hypothetical protein [Kribbellaceae bacterium]